MRTLILSLFLLVSLCIHAQAPVKVACVGNSITEGYGLKDPRHEAYPALLQNILGPGYMVGNFGLSAHCVMNSSDRPYMSPVNTSRRPFQDALAFLPDIVTIKLGTNDSKIQNWEPHHQDFEKDLSALIDSFAVLPSHPQIYLCLPIPCVKEKWTIRDSVIVNEVIPCIKHVAEVRGLPVIDLYTPMKPFPELLADDVHPVRAGAMIIAEEIARRLLLDAEK